MVLSVYAGLWGFIIFLDHFLYFTLRHGVGVFSPAFFVLICVRLYLYCMHFVQILVLVNIFRYLLNVITKFPVVLALNSPFLFVRIGFTLCLARLCFTSQCACVAFNYHVSVFQYIEKHKLLSLHSTHISRCVFECYWNLKSILSSIHGQRAGIDSWAHGEYIFIYMYVYCI